LKEANMAASDVYRKTPAGLAQLAERSIKLTPLARMALVMIDGAKPVADLGSKLGSMGDVDGALATLVSAGLIEIAPVVAPAALEEVANPSATPAPAAPAPVAMSFEDLRRWAGREVSRLLGPMGDDYSMRIERAKTPEELSAALDRARSAVDGMVSKAKAQALWEQYLAHRGG
jgi:hypothetical protein